MLKMKIRKSKIKFNKKKIFPWTQQTIIFLSKRVGSESRIITLCLGHEGKKEKNFSKKSIYVE